LPRSLLPHSTSCLAVGQDVPNRPYRLLPSTLEKIATLVHASSAHAAMPMACVLLHMRARVVEERSRASGTPADPPATAWATTLPRIAMACRHSEALCSGGIYALCS